MIQECSARDYFENLSRTEGVLLIDVRNASEFMQHHATGAINIPLETLSTSGIQALSRKTKIFFICKGGNRSRKACEMSDGCSTVSISGGTEAWLAAGLPVEKGKTTMSLERQVRIAAGAIVLAGVLLGAVAHPAFFAISAFVGAGLIFAGITDWCGMALLLKKMPWNRG